MVPILLILMIDVPAAPQPSMGAHCRCLPGNPCWEKVPWGKLNTSVHGRLERSVDMMQPCLNDIASKECTNRLQKGVDDDEWISGQPYNLQHTGYFGAWNIKTDYSHFTVKAETSDDFAATVGFAHQHNLRLVVKGTGHDWYGRSAAAGSLLLWTHLRKNKVWHDAFVPEGCPATANDAMAQGKLVVGGTCPTVGVGGCWLSGCYGAFARKYGSGAMNILQAKVVLANGTLVTANKCQHPDLFWSLRGGGGGNVGVVVDFVARAHPAPVAMWSLSLKVATKSAAEYKMLLEEILAVYAVMAADADSASDGGFGFGTESAGETATWDASTNYTASVNLIGYFTTPAKQLAIVQPILDYIHNRSNHQDSSHPDSSSSGSSGSGAEVDYTITRGSWNAKDDYNKSANNKQLGDISMSQVDMKTKFVPLSYIQSAEGQAKLAASLVGIAGAMPVGLEIGVMTPKAQGGISAEQRAIFKETSLNPILLDTAGTLLLYVGYPWLQQLPPSTQHLKALWFKEGNELRNATYMLTNATDPIRHVCKEGAERDNHTAAVACMGYWTEVIIPKLQHQIAKVKVLLDKALPHTDASGNPFSGAYWAETDYYESEWSTAYWGKATYAKLLAVKRKYDPDGLFICRHCVGAEYWTEQSKLNCRNLSMVTIA
eukprot:gene10062-29166_t